MRDAHRQSAGGAAFSEIARQTCVVQSSVRRKCQGRITTGTQAREDAFSPSCPGSPPQHDIGEAFCPIGAHVDFIPIDAVLVRGCDHVLRIRRIDDDVGLILWVVAGGAAGKLEGGIADDSIGSLRAGKWCVERCRIAKERESGTSIRISGC